MRNGQCNASSDFVSKLSDPRSITICNIITAVINSPSILTTSQEQRSGVCLYTVGVGNRLSRTRLDTVDSCGHSVAADKVAQPRDMAHFVQNILYKGPADTDGDGIYDYRDRCLNTHAGRIVDYSGCPRFANNNLGAPND